MQELQYRKSARAAHGGGGGGGGACNRGKLTITLYSNFTRKWGGGRNSEQGVTARQYGKLKPANYHKARVTIISPHIMLGLHPKCHYVSIHYVGAIKSYKVSILNQS